MIEFISQAWPWYISGPLMGGMMLLLYYFGTSFGVSSNLSTLCSMTGAGRFVEQFRFDWKSQTWNLLFMVGIILGGAISAAYLGGDRTAGVSESTVQDLKAIGISTESGERLLPPQLFSDEAFQHPSTLLFLLVGGALVGFGARYAGGCTSGHAITGLSNLQRPSLIAVIGFFIGGLLMTHFLLPYIIGYATH